jgi:hypothetical protein
MAYTGPFRHTNTGITGSITVSNTKFSGNVGNTGTISTGGIKVVSSTIEG